ncbi:hypothetical protein TNCV_1461001 [Trichonephila clavipes]|nr:hypothetical protein TNCV_1461001 [Trichonephila clavipes]
MVDITKDLETVDSEPEEDVTPLDENYWEGLNFPGKLAKFFYSNDNDVERALKFQRDLEILYVWLQRTPLQRTSAITEFDY